MSNLMHKMSAPVFTHQLKNLSAILKTAAKDAKTRGIDPTVILSARLAPDMLPLSRQVQIASDHAKGCCARLTGVDSPAFADNEQTFADLQARIKKTLAFIRSIKPAQYADSAEREIVMKIPIGKLGFNGLDYLTGWALPNFYFHYSTAFDILRSNGVAIGKGDFLGTVPGMKMSGKIGKMMQKK